MHSLNDMAIFAAVVDTGGFTSASKKLGISTPVVSKRITALEQYLGTKLLFRTTRKLSLTEAGSVYYQYCSSVVSDAEQAKAAVTYLDATPRGLLKITAPIAAGSYQVANALPSFLERYPEVQVELDISDRVVDIAEEGYDIAIRLTHQPPELYVARLLSKTKRKVCASPEYWQRHGRPTSPADLASHNCIVYSERPNYNQWVFNGKNGPETIAVQGSFRVNNTIAMLEAATSGLGVLMLTSVNVDRAIFAGQLEPVLEDYDTPGPNIYALYLPNRYLSSKARAFIDYMVEWCKE